jgi:isopentenyl phosphate kinase
VNPSSLLVLDGKQPQHFCIEPVKHMLKIGLLPVIYGDVILDSAQGFTIWSTEQLLNFLAGTLEADGVAIDKIIHCGETDGFLIGGEVVHEITRENFEQMKKNITATEGFDVTGGMLHKIEEALKTATHGIDSYIIGGNHGGNLYRAIIGDQFIGTRIRV